MQAAFFFFACPIPLLPSLSEESRPGGVGVRPRTRWQRNIAAVLVGRMGDICGTGGVERCAAPCLCMRLCPASMPSRVKRQKRRHPRQRTHSKPMSYGATTFSSTVGVTKHGDEVDLIRLHRVRIEGKPWGFIHSQLQKIRAPCSDARKCKVYAICPSPRTVLLTASPVCRTIPVGKRTI